MLGSIRAATRFCFQSGQHLQVRYLHENPQAQLEDKFMKIVQADDLKEFMIFLQHLPIEVHINCSHYVKQLRKTTPPFYNDMYDDVPDWILYAVKTNNEIGRYLAKNF